MNYDALMKKARATNAERDRIERRELWCTPTEADLPVFLATVISAIQAGIVRDNWDYVAEAQAMLIEYRATCPPEERGDA